MDKILTSFNLDLHDYSRHLDEFTLPASQSPLGAASRSSLQYIPASQIIGLSLPSGQ